MVCLIDAQPVDVRLFHPEKGLSGWRHQLPQSRLTSVRATKGEDQFHSFYRAFLLKLFHGGLATPTDARDAETAKLLGNIPYLNGGLFEPHALEADGNNITIADAAFEGVFNFFDQYEWTLDTRAIERADGREINPDVLGHIFEKYINQKQMGAYYTKEDITDYITKNTVIPWLFQNALTHDKVAFEAGSAVWRMLSENPDAYIYKAVNHGADEPLPANIAAGIADVAQRGDWNKTAPATHGLPTEIWREVVARRERYEVIKAKAAAGEIASIEDFITHNLDIRQFARDAIQYAESPDLVRAFWKGISAIKVLDPACGSGAFLFAALGILYDLYDACLERMEQFVESAPEGGGPRQLYSDFRTVLEQIERHPNRPYFIYKSIILDNLYGVDIMDEAVEICKLRLFLKLASQLERADQIEPLPDIDFNIRAGNTLIGYTSFADVERATNAAGLDFDGRAAKIKADMEDYASALGNFRLQQTQLGGEIGPAAKVALKERLAVIKPKLDRYLAQDYGVDVGDDLAATAAVATWKTSHKPFHWLIEFYGIINGGGFDVVVGNPPYVKASDVRKEYSVRGYTTDRCSDMYAWIMERAAKLASLKGHYGMIVPLSLTFSGNFQSLRDFLLTHFSANWFSSFARIPAALFSADVRVRNTIHIGQRAGQSGHHTTITHRWFEEARPHLVERIEYANFDPKLWDGLIPKLGNQHLLSSLESAKARFRPLDAQISAQANRNQLHFKKSAYNWVSFGYAPAPSYDSNGKILPTTESGLTSFESPDSVKLAHTFLNGKIAFIWWVIVGDDFHVTKANFETIPFVKDLDKEDKEILSDLSDKLNNLMIENTVFKLNAGKRIGNFNLARCRELTDISDVIWARNLGLSHCLDEIELSYCQVVKTNFDDADDGVVDTD
jgi:Eco57I restriction-modification methylase